MGTAHFWEEAPSVDVREDMVFFAEQTKRASCMRIATARSLHRRLGAALAMYDAQRGVVVAPLRVAEREH